LAQIYAASRQARSSHLRARPLVTRESLALQPFSVGIPRLLSGCPPLPDFGLSVTVSGVHRGACYTNQKDSFLKFMRIREDTAAITRRVYVEPAARKVDFARRAGKRLPAEVEAP
jgi:hypothetical protein